MHDPPSISALLAELAAFAAMVEQRLSPEHVDWQWRPTSSEWCLTEVVCHLRDVEREVHQVRFRRLLEVDNAFLPGENPDAWVAIREYALEEGRMALAAFVEARHETLALLEGISDPSLWERSGRHAFLGSTSMHELANLVVRHDRAHREQINTLLTSPD